MHATLYVCHVRSLHRPKMRYTIRYYDTYGTLLWLRNCASFPPECLQRKVAVCAAACHTRRQRCQNVVLTRTGLQVGQSGKQRGNAVHWRRNGVRCRRLGQGPNGLGGGLAAVRHEHYKGGGIDEVVQENSMSHKNN